MHRALTAAFLVFLSACAGDTGAPDVQEVALVDSVPYSNALVGNAWLRRVAVRTTDGNVDTLAGVLTDQRPVVAGDSMVFGFLYDEDRVDGAFEYHSRNGSLQRRELPADLYEYSTPRFSPDGRWLAYMARDSAGLGFAVVARWPEGTPVHIGPKARLLETDAGVDRIEWRGPQIFEILIDLSMADSGGVQRVRGTVDGAVTVDTLVGAGR